MSLLANIVAFLGAQAVTTSFLIMCIMAQEVTYREMPTVRLPVRWRRFWLVSALVVGCIYGWLWVLGRTPDFLASTGIWQGMGSIAGCAMAALIFGRTRLAWVFPA